MVRKIILFTKYFRDFSIQQLIKTIKYVGAEGADLCVRQGYQVEPDSSEKLPEIVKNFKDEGLSIPLITMPVDFVEPEKPVVEKVFSFCQQAGIKFIKIGYWFFEKEGYWKKVEEIKKKIEKFENLARKFNVKVLIHNHSGMIMSVNSCGVMNLIKNFNPEYIGVFLDPGHLSISGEPLRMAVDIVRDYLSAVAIKDLIFERVVENGKRKWNKRVVPLGEGFVDWELFVKLLNEIKFNGPVSIHSEYEHLDKDTLTDQTRIDIRYFKKLLNSPA